MPTNLDSFYSNKFRQSSTTQLETVLCIVEGGDELSFIKKIYEIHNSSITCSKFLHNKIKLSYGRGLIGWQGNTPTQKHTNKQKCNFQGGDLSNKKAPYPILESLNNEDLSLYKAIIVIYDKDRDINNIVRMKSKQILENHSQYILYISAPCFERESITFFNNIDIDKYIIKNYKIIEGSQCKWYKQNYQNLLRLNPIGNCRKLSTLIPLLTHQQILSPTINSKIKNLISFIHTNIT